jgi:hypothetical protein
MITITRYVVTFINPSGVRTFALPLEPKYTYPIPAAAEAQVAHMLACRSPENSAKVFGDPHTLRVDPVLCNVETCTPLDPNQTF